MAEKREWLIIDPNGRSYWREKGHGYSGLLGAGLFTKSEAEKIIHLRRGDRMEHVSTVNMELEAARKALAYFDACASESELSSSSSGPRGAGARADHE